MSEENTEVVVEAPQEGTDTAVPEAPANPLGATQEPTLGGPVEETPPAAPAPSDTWPENWRQRIASSFDSESDQTAALNQLERMGGPENLFKSYRELQLAMSSGQMAKLPGEDASDEERAAYYKRINQPDTAEGLVENLSLSEGKQLGDMDRPAADAFASAIYGAVTPQEITNRAIDWYLGLQEQQASEQDDIDERNELESREALREEWGAGYKRELNIANMAFNGAPEMQELLMDARLADGTLFANNPTAIKWLNHMARQSNPIATVTEDGADNIESVEAEIERIETTMREDRPRYNRDEKMQARYRKLLGVRENAGKRQAA